MMDFEGLNNEQKKAVTHTDGPLLIVAGAGTGKTSVITKKIAYLIEQDLAKPDEIVALTFTEKAATEMEERVDQLLPFGYVDVVISTFHSFCEKILRSHAIDIGLSTDFKLLNQIEQWLLVRNNFESFKLDYYKPRSKPTRTIYAFLSHFSRCKDEGISPQQYIQFAKKLTVKNADFIDSENEDNKQQEIDRIKEVAHAYDTYQKLLLEQNALDFGDLVFYTIELLKTRPHILEQYQKLYKYILVDEFQDTNIAQYDLVKLLSAKHQNLTVCGDDDQSIYKFRGASVSNVLHFQQDYPNAKSVVLTQNYRSSQGILDCAYQFIQLNNPDRLEAKGEIDKKLQADSEEKGNIAYIYAKTQQGEINAVVNRILEIKERDEEADWSDFAILSRTNQGASVFCPTLTKANIPFQFVSLRGLFQKPVILNIISYLKVLKNVHDSPSLYRVLHMPMIHMNEYDLSQCNYHAKRKAFSLYDSFLEIQTIPRVSSESVKMIKKLTGLIQKHLSLAKEKRTSELLLLVLHDLGYLQYLTHHREDVSFYISSEDKPLFESEKPEQFTPKEILEKEEELGFVRQFYDHIREFEATNPDLKLFQFMEQFDLELEAGESGHVQPFEDGPEMVKVMTVHSSKGLEFKYVFIVQMVEQRFPSTNRKDPIELPEPLIRELLPEGDVHLQEERRLLYVAMTRAKRHLYFTFASDYGGLRKKKPSRFLYEAKILSKEKTFEEDTVTHVQDIEKEHIPQMYKPNYLLPKWFSFTQLAAFNKCPLQYKYAHILKIPTFGKSVFSYGKTLHNTLQKYVQVMVDSQGGAQQSIFSEKKEKAEKPSLQTLVKLYEESWIPDWYETQKEQDEAKKKGKETLKAFHEHFIETDPHPIMVEQGFKLKLNQYTLVGSIDRVDRLPDGKVEIIDYKTGRSKTEKELDLDDKMQLLIYQMAAKEVLGLDVGQLTFYYLDDNSAVSFIGTQEELDTMRSAILDHIKKIHNSDFEPTPGFWCQFCDFNSICEHRANV